jgi:hypothetical protein
MKAFIFFDIILTAVDAICKLFVIFNDQTEQWLVKSEKSFQRNVIIDYSNKAPHFLVAWLKGSQSLWNAIKYIFF